MGKEEGRLRARGRGRAMVGRSPLRMMTIFFLNAFASPQRGPFLAALGRRWASPIPRHVFQAAAILASTRPPRPHSIPASLSRSNAPATSRSGRCPSTAATDRRNRSATLRSGRMLLDLAGTGRALA
jgi:hypothetical protein